MVLADEILFAAGPIMAPSAAGMSEPTFDAQSPASLMAFEARDGQDLKHVPLEAQPVFDGLVAAGSRLYMSLVDGSVVCLGE
jgi:hypothetical protein